MQMCKESKKIDCNICRAGSGAFERFCWLCQSQSCCGPHVIKSAYRWRMRNSSRDIRFFPWLIAKQSKSTRTISSTKLWHTKKKKEVGGLFSQGQQLAALGAAQNFCLTVSTEIGYHSYKQPRSLSGPLSWSSFYKGKLEPWNSSRKWDNQALNLELQEHLDGSYNYN